MGRVEYINVKPDDLKVTVKDPQSGKILVDPKVPYHLKHMNHFFFDRI